MKPLRICLVNLNCYCLFNPESQAPMGGAELEIYTLARTLAANHPVVVVTGDWGQPAREEYEGVTVLRSIRLGSGYLRQLIIFWKSLAAADADVYLSTGAGAEAGIIAFFCRLRGKTYVYRTAHDIDCDGSFIKSKAVAGRLFALALSWSTYIVTSVRRHGKMITETNHWLSGKVRHINLMLQPSVTRPAASKKYVLWVSRCEKWKRPELFLELARRLPEQPFVMIAPRQSHRPELFEEIRAQAALLPNLEFHGLIPFKEIQPYYDRARIFVNTSEAEGFTYTLLHSGLAGTPVAYLSVNPDGVITDQSLGCWAEGDMDKLTGQIRHLLSDHTAWERASSSIFHYITLNFTAKTVAKEWEKLLESLR